MYARFGWRPNSSLGGLAALLEFCSLLGEGFCGLLHPLCGFLKGPYVAFYRSTLFRTEKCDRNWLWRWILRAWIPELRLRLSEYVVQVGCRKEHTCPRTDRPRAEHPQRYACGLWIIHDCLNVAYVELNGGRKLFTQMRGEGKEFGFGGKGGKGSNGSSMVRLPREVSRVPSTTSRLPLLGDVWRVAARAMVMIARPVGFGGREAAGRWSRNDALCPQPLLF